MGERKPIVISVKLEATDLLTAIRALPESRTVVPVLNRMGPLCMAMLLYGRFVAHASDRRLVLFLLPMAALAALMALGLGVYHNTLTMAVVAGWLQEQGDGATRFSFDEGGVEITSLEKQRTCANLLKQVETAEAFVIWCPLLAVVPKRALEDQQVALLRSWLARVPNEGPDPHARSRLLSQLKIWGVIAALAWTIFHVIPN